MGGTSHLDVEDAQFLSSDLRTRLSLVVWGWLCIQNIASTSHRKTDMFLLPSHPRSQRDPLGQRHAGELTYDDAYSCLRGRLLGRPPVLLVMYLYGMRHLAPVGGAVGAARWHSATFVKCMGLPPS